MTRGDAIKYPLCLIPLLMMTLPTNAMELFVGLNGADMSPGTKAQPLASLEAARDSLRRVPTLQSGLIRPDRHTRSDVPSLSKTILTERSRHGVVSSPVDRDREHRNHIFTIGWSSRPSPRPVSGNRTNPAFLRGSSEQTSNRLLDCRHAAGST